MCSHVQLLLVSLTEWLNDTYWEANSRAVIEESLDSIPDLDHSAKNKLIGLLDEYASVKRSDRRDIKAQIGEILKTSPAIRDFVNNHIVSKSN